MNSVFVLTGPPLFQPDGILGVWADAEAVLAAGTQHLRDLGCSDVTVEIHSHPNTGARRVLAATLRGTFEAPWRPLDLRRNPKAPEPSQQPIFAYVHSFQIL